MAREILIIMEGGLVQEIHNIPADVVVRVKDYDVADLPEDALQQDRDGERYYETVWYPEETEDPPEP